MGDDVERSSASSTWTASSAGRAIAFFAVRFHSGAGRRNSRVASPAPIRGLVGKHTDKVVFRLGPGRGSLCEHCRRAPPPLAATARRRRHGRPGCGDRPGSLRFRWHIRPRDLVLDYPGHFLRQADAERVGGAHDKSPLFPQTYGIKHDLILLPATLPRGERGGSRVKGLSGGRTSATRSLGNRDP